MASCAESNLVCKRSQSTNRTLLQVIPLKLHWMMFEDMNVTSASVAHANTQFFMFTLTNDRLRTTEKSKKHISKVVDEI